MEALRTFGVAVERQRRGNESGWYVAERDFQLPELRLLVDSVQSSRFITRKKSLELIGKIEALGSTHEAKTLRRQVWVKNRIKSMNESIYYIVDDIQAAIEEDRQIRFRYFRYDEKKQRVLRREGGWYVLSPFALLWDSENYYLVGYESESGILKHFRVDKMTELSVTERPREGKEVFASQDMAVYNNAHFGMFSGAPAPVRMEFKNELAGAVIDRFGSEILLIPAGEGRFTVTVPVAVNAPFYGWLCSFGDGVKLLAPESAVEGMRAHIAAVTSRYTSEKA